MDAGLRAGERRDEPDCCFAVERTAALFEQRRLLVQRRVAVQLEQLALDLGDDGRARRRAVELLREHLVVRVEVLEVVRRNDAELVEQPPRLADVGGQLVAVVGEESGRTSSSPTHTDRTQVRWLRPTWSTTI